MFSWFTVFYLLVMFSQKGGLGVVLLVRVASQHVEGIVGNHLGLSALPARSLLLRRLALAATRVERLHLLVLVACRLLHGRAAAFAATLTSRPALLEAKSRA